MDAHAGDQGVEHGQCEALDRSAYVLGLGTGAVDCSAVAPVKMAELARRGMTAKAPKIKALEDDRRAATLLATVRHLEGVSVDDALLLFDLLMSTKLLSQAGRAGDKEKLKNPPRLRWRRPGWRRRGRSCGTPRRRRSGRTVRRRIPR